MRLSSRARGVKGRETSRERLNKLKSPQKSREREKLYHKVLREFCRTLSKSNGFFFLHAFTFFQSCDSDQSFLFERSLLLFLSTVEFIPSKVVSFTQTYKLSSSTTNCRKSVSDSLSSTRLEGNFLTGCC